MVGVTGGEDDAVAVVAAVVLSLRSEAVRVLSSRRFHVKRAIAEGRIGDRCEEEEEEYVAVGFYDNALDTIKKSGASGLDAAELQPELFP